MKVNQGYAAYILLTDSNDDIIKDQSDFDFSWSIDDPNSGILITGNDCYYGLYNINPPCPKISMVFNSKKIGSTKIRVGVTRKSENRVIDEGIFNLTVN